MQEQWSNVSYWMLEIRFATKVWYEEDCALIQDSTILESVHKNNSQ